VGYDRETVDLMTRAIDEAWREFAPNCSMTAAELEKIHADMVACVVAAVKDGDRDVAHLKSLALSAVPWN